jgi:release factor glutamine methyltransferase
MTQTGTLLLREAAIRLRPVLGAGAPRDARVLLAHALNVAVDRLTLVLPDPVSAETAEQYEIYVLARLDRQPVSQIIGKRMFWGRLFLVTGDVLDPRPETETLIDLALSQTSPERILDLGVGSGCILLTLLAEFPSAKGIGVDKSAAACRVAQNNATVLGVAPRAGIQVSDWFENVTDRFDLVVSNPPYITSAEMADLDPEVARWEPEMALTPGVDGLGAYRVLANGLEQVLAPNGVAFFEFGKDQAKAVTEIFADAGFTDTEVFCDLNGHDRIIRVQRS